MGSGRNAESQNKKKVFGIAKKRKGIDGNAFSIFNLFGQRLHLCCKTIAWLLCSSSCLTSPTPTTAPTDDPAFVLLLSSLPRLIFFFSFWAFYPSLLVISDIFGSVEKCNPRVFLAQKFHNLFVDSLCNLIWFLSDYAI